MVVKTIFANAKISDIMMTVIGRRVKE